MKFFNVFNEGRQVWALPNITQGLLVLAVSLVVFLKAVFIVKSISLWKAKFPPITSPSEIKLSENKLSIIFLRKCKPRAYYRNFTVDIGRRSLMKKLYFQHLQIWVGLNCENWAWCLTRSISKVLRADKEIFHWTTRPLLKGLNLKQYLPNLLRL